MIDKIRQVLEAEAEAIRQIPLDESVEAAVRAILDCTGKVFTTGLGKAGHIAQKAASTFCTTGTPSVFLHPADASHGDVGVVAKGDVLVAYSNSGRTREVIETVTLCRELGLGSIITITGQKDSPLGEASDITIDYGKIQEACPLGFTPSASTAVMSAISDALALVSMQERGFKKEDFALRHHGGYLGVKSRQK
jgi:arabinose-5-phosphate isomerase